MKHFLITRNAYPKTYPRLRERADLMRRFTIPSLRAQTSSNFTWILVGMGGLEEADVEGVDHLVIEKSGDENPLLTFFELQHLCSGLVADLPKGSTVITSRVDNDDALLPTYVEETQKIAMDRPSSPDPLLLDFAGYRVDLRTGAAYLDTMYAGGRLPSPFASLIETKRGDRCRIATICYDMHTQMHHHFAVRFDERPAWLQVIHDDNKLMSKPRAVIDRRGTLLPVTAGDLLDTLGF